MSTELVLARNQQPDPYTPASISEAKELATMYAASKLLGPSYGTPQQVLLVMATGAELGISATAALRGIYVVEGRVYMSADLMVALVMRSPNCQRFDLVESNAEHAVYEVQRKGGKPCRFEFGMKDVQRAGLGKGPAWSKYPATMLRHRAASEACRAVFPDVLLGVYSEEEREEIAGIPQRIAVAPAETQPVVAVPSEEPEVQWMARFVQAENMVELNRVVAEFQVAKPSLPADVVKSCREAYRHRKEVLDTPPLHDAVTGEVDREPGSDDA